MESLGLSQNDVQFKNKSRMRIKHVTGKIADKTECVCVLGAYMVRW